MTLYLLKLQADEMWEAERKLRVEKWNNDRRDEYLAKQERWNEKVKKEEEYKQRHELWLTLQNENNDYEREKWGKYHSAVFKQKKIKSLRKNFKCVAIPPPSPKRAIPFPQPKVEVVKQSRYDSFKEMKFTINDPPIHLFEGHGIWDTIEQCSERGIKRYYDYLYPLYMDGKVSPREWNAVENLLWNQGNELITRRMIEIKEDEENE